MKVVIAIGIIAGARFIWLAINEVERRKKYWRDRP